MAATRMATALADPESILLLMKTKKHRHQTNFIWNIIDFNALTSPPHMLPAGTRTYPLRQMPGNRGKVQA